MPTMKEVLSDVIVPTLASAGAAAALVKWGGHVVVVLSTTSVLYTAVAAGGCFLLAKGVEAALNKWVLTNGWNATNSTIASLVQGGVFVAGVYFGIIPLSVVSPLAPVVAVVVLFVSNYLNACSTHKGQIDQKIKTKDEEKILAVQQKEIEINEIKQKLILLGTEKDSLLNQKNEVLPEMEDQQEIETLKQSLEEKIKELKQMTQTSEENRLKLEEFQKIANAITDNNGKFSYTSPYKNPQNWFKGLAQDLKKAMEYKGVIN